MYTKMLRCGEDRGHARLNNRVRIEIAWRMSEQRRDVHFALKRCNGSKAHGTHESMNVSKEEIRSMKRSRDLMCANRVVE